MHLIADWLTPFRNIIRKLKPDGHFIYAEETGDTRWIDNRFDNPARIKRIAEDPALEASFKFWNRFHKLRGSLTGKTWDQDIIASDMSLISAMLDRLRWEGTAFEKKWEPREKYRLNDYVRWLGGTALYNPVVADLSKSDLAKIRLAMKKEGVWNEAILQTEIPREEGHRFWVWKKKNEPGMDRKKLEELTLKCLVENESSNLLRRIILLRHRAEDIKNLSRDKESLRTIIRNRSYLLYKFLFRSRRLIQIDYTVWEPTDTSLVGDYLNNLDIVLQTTSNESLYDYISSYTIYTNVRPIEEKLFLTIIFQEQNLLNKIIIKRSDKPSCKVHLLHDGSMSKILLDVPAVLPKLLDRKTWKLVLRELKPYSQAVAQGNRVFYNFDAIRQPFGPGNVSFRKRFVEVGRQLSKLEGLTEYRTLEDRFRSEIKAKVWNQDEQKVLLDDEYVNAFIKSVFFLELLGYGTPFTWKRIAFLPGLFIRSDENYKGFSCPVIIEGDAEGADYWDFIEPLVWNLSQQDGLIEYAGLVATEILKGGTKAAIVALIGRSMSHNIGSHATYQLEQKEKQQLGADEHTLRARFYAYLRERMDFVAAVATQIPIWTTTKRLRDLIREINENKLLLQNIARSEGVEQVEIKCTEGSEIEVALPGGVLGIQALCTIIENVIRDGAKYGRSKKRNKNVMQIEIRASSSKKQSDLVRIELSDDRSTSAPLIKSAIREIARDGLADDKGSLRPANWGIKERYIAAVLLRGEKVEDVLLGGYKPSLPILDTKEIDGKLAWVFYLLAPKHALVVSDKLKNVNIDQSNKKNVEIVSWDQLQKVVISTPSRLRHEFVIIDAAMGEVDADESLSGSLRYLPYRLVPCAEGLRERLSQKDFVSNIRLEWIKILLKRSKFSFRVSFFNGDEEERWLVTESSINQAEKDSDMMSVNDGSIIIDSHANRLEDCFPKGRLKRRLKKCLHYEPHEKGFSIRRLEDVICSNATSLQQKREIISGLVEAAIIKILIVDERLDEDIDKANTEFKGAGGIRVRDLLSAKGIVIKGKEYASASGEAREDRLLEWTNAGVVRAHQRPYDFVLLHQGIADKLHSQTNRARRKIDYTRELVDRLKQRGVFAVIIHSGRGAPEIPENTRFIPLSSIENWITRHLSKYEIVQELMALRQRKESVEP